MQQAQQQQPAQTSNSPASAANREKVTVVFLFGFVVNWAASSRNEFDSKNDKFESKNDKLDL
jgi:hypothetical protein